MAISSPLLTTPALAKRYFASFIPLAKVSFFAIKSSPTMSIFSFH